MLFPRKERLPKCLEERLDELAKGHVEVLYAALKLLASEEPTTEEFDEISHLVTETYAKSFEKAIDEFEG